MRAYVPADFADVAAWCRGHGEPPPRHGTLPATGVIAPGLAAGFLYRSDSTVSMIGGFVTNPAAPLRARAAALRAIASALLAGTKGPVIALTRSPGIARMAASFGLRPTGHFALLERGAQ